MIQKGQTEEKTQPLEITAEQLLALIQGLLRESPLHAEAADHLSLDSRRERDLGLDSLTLAELLTRVDDEFGAALPHLALPTESPRALLELINAARGGGQISTAEPTPMPGKARQQTPVSTSTSIQTLDCHQWSHPEHMHILLYGDEPEPINYADLWQGVNRVSTGLLQRGLAPVTGSPSSYPLDEAISSVFSTPCWPERYLSHLSSHTPLPVEGIPASPWPHPSQCRHTNSHNGTRSPGRGTLGVAW